MKLVSINVQQNIHLDKIARLIKSEQPDIVALMEVREVDIPELLADYPYREFGANFRLLDGSVCGVVIAAKTPLSEVEVLRPDGISGDEVPAIAIGVGVYRPVLVIAKVAGVELGAVHFTWTPDMSVTKEQTDHLTKMLEILGEREIILTGDFNIPRGNSNYQMLADKYHDNVPSGVLTTIDPKLHRVNKEVEGKLTVVVDYVWSTPTMQVSDLRVITGVSDHCALIADVVCNI